MHFMVPAGVTSRVIIHIIRFHDTLSYTILGCVYSFTTVQIYSPLFLLDTLLTSQKEECIFYFTAICITFFLFVCMFTFRRRKDYTRTTPVSKSCIRAFFLRFSCSRFCLSRSISLSAVVRILAIAVCSCLSSGK